MRGGQQQLTWSNLWSRSTHLVGFVHGELTTAEYEPSLLPRFAPLSLLHQVPTLEGDVLAQTSAVATGPDRFEERPTRAAALSENASLGALRPLPEWAGGGGCEAGGVGFCVAAGPEGVFGLGDGREGKVDARPVEWWRRRVRFVLGAGTVSRTRDGRGMRWLFQVPESGGQLRETKRLDRLSRERERMSPNGTHPAGSATSPSLEQRTGFFCAVGGGD